MKKSLIFAAFLLSSFLMTAQDKFLAKTGHVWFFSSTPMENIEAHNNQVTSYVDVKTGEVAFQMLVKSFKFKSALMEEHFNENYMESVKYPKAEFKGKIVNLADIKFGKPGVYKAVIEGDLTIHGTLQKVKHEGTFEVKGSQLVAKSKFQVVPQDYKIEIPSLVKDKIAEKLDVNVDIVYDVYKK